MGAWCLYLFAKADLLLALGLIIVVLGSFLLIIDPPRTITYSSSVMIPYTVFEETPPGYHNYTILHTAGEGGLHVKMPGDNSTKINIDTLEAKNCVPGRLVLKIFSEGVFEAADDKYVDITLLTEQDNKTVLLDHINIPIKASSITVTGTPYTVTLRPGETLSEPPELPTTSYEVKSAKGLLHATVHRPGENIVKVNLDTGASPIPVSLNTTAILLKASGNAHGELHVWVRAQYQCVTTYYLDKPLYKPHISYQKVNIENHYFELGNLVPAIILISIGHALMLVSCNLATRKQGS